MSKLGILVGFGAGYVLGARAGRERYDQLMEKAQQMWRDPRVQQRASQAQDLAQEKASQAAGAVQGAVKHRVPGLGEHGSDASNPGASGTITTPPAPTR